MLSCVAVLLVAGALQQAGIDAQELMLELRSPDIARREVAAKRLILMGDQAADVVRPYLGHPDPILGVYARRIFGAVRGVSPEIDAQVTEAIAAATEVGAPAVVDRIRRLGKDAVIYATRRLSSGQSTIERTIAAALETDLRLDSIFAAGNQNDVQYDALQKSASEAQAALHGVLQDRQQPRDRRLVALWALAGLPPARRVAELAPFLREEDPVVRREAAGALSGCVDRDSFESLAIGLDGRANESAEILAGAAARRLSPEQLLELLQARDDKVASLAARALGETRVENVASALARRLEETQSLEVKRACVDALTDVPGSVARFALLATFANELNPALRADALAALAARADATQSLLAFGCGLQDRNDRVRLTAASCLSGLGTIAAGPAASGSAVPPARSFASTAHEAARIVTEAREVLLGNAIVLDSKVPLSPAALNRAAMTAMATAFEDPASLHLQGLERPLLRRLVADSVLDAPEQVFAVAADLPFDAPAGDLIQLTTGAVRGMVDSLRDRYAHVIASHDPEGRALPEWAPELFGPESKTNGLSLRWDEQSAFVDFVLQRSPSERAGLNAGDQIIAVEGQFLKHLSKGDVEKLLSKEVRISVLRDGWSRPYDFTVTPEEIRQQDVASAFPLPAGIGYLALRNFEQGCANRLEQALRELEDQGLRGLIIDLRNNPGGSLTECADLADKFLPGGLTIATLKGSGGSQQTIVSTASDRDRTYPVAVLVNRCSASASEMFAGCLQELSRATLVGETTFGKGVGQAPHFVSGFPSETPIGETRSQYLLYFTVIRYELASGRVVQGLGLQPDVAVVSSRMSGPLFEERLRLRDDPRVVSYGAQLLSENRDLVLQIALSGRGAAVLPGLDELAQSVGTFLPRAELGLVVRQVLRGMLGNMMALPPDYVEDRALQEAVLAVARALKLGDSELKEFGLDSRQDPRK